MFTQVNYRLCRAQPRIPSFLVQWLSIGPRPLLMSCSPDPLIWSVIFFWNFWPTAVTLEAQPMSIYNRQLYSKGLPKCPWSSRRAYNDLLCAGSRWVFGPRPWAPDRIRLEARAPESSFVCLMLSVALSCASSEQWEMRFGEGAGDHFPCDSLSLLRWGRKDSDGSTRERFPTT